MEGANITFLSGLNVIILKKEECLFQTQHLETLQMLRLNYKIMAQVPISLNPCIEPTTFTKISYSAMSRHP